MAKESKVHFSNLDERSKNFSLYKIADKKISLNIWQKGQEQKEVFRAEEFRGKEDRLLVSSENETSLVDKTVLINFELDGLNYFFSGLLAYDKYSRKYEISCREKLYKSERRINFRIQFYPDERSYIIIEKEKGQKPSIGKLALFDVSATGISFLITDVEAENYKDGQILKEMKMSLKGNLYTIPKAEVVYRMNSGVSANTKKMALKYIDLPVPLEEKLFKQLTKEMRSVDIGNEFEEFLK